LYEAVLWHLVLLWVSFFLLKDLLYDVALWHLKVLLWVSFLLLTESRFAPTFAFALWLFLVLLWHHKLVRWSCLLPGKSTFAKWPPNCFFLHAAYYRKGVFREKGPQVQLQRGQEVENLKKQPMNSIV
jgi:hypothetical protein